MARAGAKNCRVKKGSDYEPEFVDPCSSRPRGFLRETLSHVRTGAPQRSWLVVPSTRRKDHRIPRFSVHRILSLGPTYLKILNRNLQCIVVNVVSYNQFRQCFREGQNSLFLCLKWRTTSSPLINLLVHPDLYNNTGKKLLYYMMSYGRPVLLNVRRVYVLYEWRKSFWGSYRVEQYWLSSRVIDLDQVYTYSEESWRGTYGDRR